MAQILKLKHAGQIWRDAINVLCKKSQEGIVKDEKDQTVAIVLPLDRYESYKTYLRQREEDFAIFDEVDEVMRGYDPVFIEARIEKAVAEVKAESKEKQRIGL